MIRLGSILIMLFLLTACGGGDSAEGELASTGNATATSKPTAERERFMLRDVDGGLRKWSEFAGKPVVVNFWATWCGPCRHEIPMLKNLYEEYKNQGVKIVGISLDKETNSAQNVVPFINQMQIPWVIVYGDRGAAMEFGLGQSIPMTVFFNAAGEETGRITGAQSEELFRKEFEKMVQS